ncbi:hypothetical protein Q4560_17685 [Celeribacter halophilus]|nr:hypothetical protein [Celeribacter halophilus]MDO6725102.1 hypothetical protein [Celeribacter halophilus]
MSVTLDVTDSLYSYNGTLLQLGAVTVLPAFPDVAGTAITIEDDDGTLTPSESSTITIDGTSETVTYVGVASFNESGLIGGVLGALLGSTEAAVFETSSGELYIYAPDGFPVLGGVASTVEIDTGADFDLAPSTPGVVDGTSGDDNMDVGYEDDDGDEITDYKASVPIFGGGNPAMTSSTGTQAMTQFAPAAAMMISMVAPVTIQFMGKTASTKSMVRKAMTSSTAGMGKTSLPVVTATTPSMVAISRAMMFTKILSTAVLATTRSTQVTATILSMVKMATTPFLRVPTTITSSVAKATTQLLPATV